jgi:hypothetical protein
MRFCLSKKKKRLVCLSANEIRVAKPARFATLKRFAQVFA